MAVRLAILRGFGGSSSMNQNGQNTIVNLEGKKLLVVNMWGRIEKLHGLNWRKKRNIYWNFLSLFVLRCLYFLFIAVMIEVLVQVPCMVGRYGLGFYSRDKCFVSFCGTISLPFVYPIVLAHVVMVWVPWLSFVEMWGIYMEPYNSPFFKSL